MAPRLRVVGYSVQFTLMVDEDDNLTPWPPPDDKGQSQVVGINVPSSEWPNVMEHVAGALDLLREQVEGPTPSPPLAEERFCGTCQKYEAVDGEDRCLECGAGT